MYSTVFGHDPNTVFSCGGVVGEKHRRNRQRSADTPRCRPLLCGHNPQSPPRKHTSLSGGIDIADKIEEVAAPIIINPRKAFVRIPVQRQNYLPLLTFLRTYDLNEKLPVPVFLRLHFRYFGGIVLYIQPFPRFAGENIPGKTDNALISLHG